VRITKREVFASVSIISVMLIIGLLLSSKISDRIMDRNEIYNKAVKIESSELFKYGMETGIGNAFVYGDLTAVDTVTYPEIGKKYMYVKKEKQRYTMHTRRVKSGKHYHTQTYWTWDTIGNENIHSKKLNFCNKDFTYEKIDIPASYYLTTISESYHVRNKYYVVDTKYKGTLFTNLHNSTISNNSKFYNAKSINETIENLNKVGKVWIVVFWFVWILVIGCTVFAFYYFENDWLE